MTDGGIKHLVKLIGHAAKSMRVCPPDVEPVPQQQAGRTGSPSWQPVFTFTSRPGQAKWTNLAPDLWQTYYRVRSETGF